MLLFDLSPIPSEATITSAVFEFYLTAEGKGFDMYRMLIPWDEATITFTQPWETDILQQMDVDAESALLMPIGQL